MVKLLYQSDFDNGHMITEPDRVMNQLEKEYQGMPKALLAAEALSPAIEHIGSGYCRVCLNQIAGGVVTDGPEPVICIKCQASQK